MEKIRRERPNEIQVAGELVCATLFERINLMRSVLDSTEDLFIDLVDRIATDQRNKARHRDT